VAVHLDSSAIVKLAAREPQSTALRRYLRHRRPLLSSALARIEVLRALMPAGADAVARGRSVLQRLDLVRVNDRILNAAGELHPADLRSLDAIHLATALELGRDLTVVVTYDERITAGARRPGIRTAHPS
jgi:predicted nucleic acid-binding protein